MPSPRLDASSVVHSRSPSRSLPDTVIRAFSSSLTTTVFSQRSMRRFDTSPPQGGTEGPNLHLLHSTAIDHSVTKRPPAFRGTPQLPNVPSLTPRSRAT